ncbi:hypothetical protein ERJ75_001168100 [Trypanosoma vivax]|nr:hypothetical protein TRVL_06769 [Trypanosoma vivax]KAH8609689.1 hypothetical protein ERJ75_001168100 [Trypanosoma vivax]
MSSTGDATNAGEPEERGTRTFAECAFAILRTRKSKSCDPRNRNRKKSVRSPRPGIDRWKRRSGAAPSLAAWAWNATGRLMRSWGEAGTGASFRRRNTGASQVRVPKAKPVPVATLERIEGG